MGNGFSPTVLVHCWLSRAVLEPFPPEVIEFRSVFLRGRRRFFCRDYHVCSLLLCSPLVCRCPFDRYNRGLEWTLNVRSEDNNIVYCVVMDVVSYLSVI